VPLSLRRRVPAGPTTDTYAPQRDSVAFRAGFVSPRTIALAIGTMRVGIGAGFAAAPVFALRVMGLDTATAARVSWLSRMTAARDGVLGAGTLAATSCGSGGGASAWLLAGAVSDAADAAALVAALRTRRVGGVPAMAMIGAAAAAALAGVWAAGSLRRR
jgi:hypothetical protein